MHTVYCYVKKTIDFELSNDPNKFELDDIYNELLLARLWPTVDAVQDSCKSAYLFEIDADTAKKLLDIKLFTPVGFYPQGVKRFQREIGFYKLMRFVLIDPFDELVLDKK